MNQQHFLATLALGLFLLVPSTSFGQGKALIISPTDGATLDPLDEIRLSYEVNPGPRGDHAHLYIDDKEVAILRKRKGDYLLETLSSGKRASASRCVQSHVPIGIGQCIQGTVK